MGLNVGVQHKNTTLPKTFTVPKTNTDRIQFGLNVAVRHRKSTLPHYFTVPNTDRTQLIPRISVSLWKTVRKKPKELQVRLNKKKISALRKLLQKNVFRPLTVKITDEYKTQTDNSDSPSENKRTKFTKTRHINPWLKILKRSQQQLKSKKNFLWCVEINRSECASPMFTVSKTYQTLKSITDLKRWTKDCYKLSLNIKMEYYKIIVDYNFSETINHW